MYLYLSSSPSNQIYIENTNTFHCTFARPLLRDWQYRVKVSSSRLAGILATGVDRMLVLRFSVLPRLADLKHQTL